MHRRQSFSRGCTFRHFSIGTWSLRTTGRPRRAAKRNASADIACRGVHGLVRRARSWSVRKTEVLVALPFPHHAERASLRYCSQPAKNVSAATTSAATSPKGFRVCRLRCCRRCMASDSPHSTASSGSLSPLDLLCGARGPAPAPGRHGEFLRPHDRRGPPRWPAGGLAVHRLEEKGETPHRAGLLVQFGLAEAEMKMMGMRRRCRMRRQPRTRPAAAGRMSMRIRSGAKAADIATASSLSRASPTT